MMKCDKCCSDKIVNYGKTRKGVQRYRCNSCGNLFQEYYRYRSWQIRDVDLVVLLRESCGIRGMGRILDISPNTVIRRILKIAGSLKRPYPILKGKIYEVDELFTYIKHKKKNKVCIVYSYEPKSGNVLDIAVGRRTKGTLQKVTDTLVLCEAKLIYTDRLNYYNDLIPGEIHKQHRRCTNHIERQNLNLRTHLKRLNRRTICYSKSLIMLLAVVKIYFWF